MDIGFIWDNDKYLEVQRKHHVRFHEVVSAFDDPKGYEVMEPTGQSGRWMWLGATAGNRILAIIYSDEDLPIYRLITAFEARKELLDEYYRRDGV